MDSLAKIVHIRTTGRTPPTIDWHSTPTTNLDSCVRHERLAQLAYYRIPRLKANRPDNFHLRIKPTRTTHAGQQRGEARGYEAPFNPPPEPIVDSDIVWRTPFGMPGSLAAIRSLQQSATATQPSEQSRAKLPVRLIR